MKTEPCPERPITFVMLYSASWQILEERVDSGWSSGFTPETLFQTIYGIRYIDDVVCRRFNSNFDSDTDFADRDDRTYYHLTDLQFSTVAVLDQNATLIERVRYNPFGEARHSVLADLDNDGDRDAGDLADLSFLVGAGTGPVIGHVHDTAMMIVRTVRAQAQDMAASYPDLESAKKDRSDA